MDKYIKWYNGLDIVIKVIFAILGIFCLLYRLFAVIKEKAKNINRLVYLIFNFIPVINIVIWVIDIVMATKGQVPLSF